MFRSLLILNLAGFALVAASGCEEKTRKAAAGVAVKGTVNLDGKPMAAGEITFSVPGEPGQPCPIAAGSFSGKGYEGVNKVEFALFKDGPPLSTDPNKTPTKVNALPTKYHFESKITAEVKLGGANEFKFDITSK